MKKEEKEDKKKSPLGSGNLCISHLTSLIKLGVVMHGEPSGPRGSTVSRLDFKEPAGYSLTDLLSLHTIDNGVEHWWHHHKTVGQQDIDMLRNVTFKAVCQYGKDRWNIKYEMTRRREPKLPTALCRASWEGI